MSQALFTDLYELTMMAGYQRNGMVETPATFDLYFRHPPHGVDLVVVAGLDPALDYLTSLRFLDEDLTYLESQDRFDRDFLEYLAQLRFTGDVWAIPEGLPVFGDEPLLRVSAPLGQAQLVETALLNRICYSSLVASNAVQITRAANGKPVLEFGARRAHGPDGALTGGRAALIGGCAGTSNVEVGRRFDVTMSGTQAHSWIMAFGDELEAFRAYARVFPDDTVLLIDTYDTLESGLPHALTVARELAEQGHRLVGVRLDSGDLGQLAAATRKRLDDAGFTGVKILASGDLDAQRIEMLEAAHAPIDSYGVGTTLLTARPDPTFSGVYKLSLIDGDPVLKISGTPEKTTSPGCKQVWRTQHGDVIGLVDEELDGDPLLVQVIRSGQRLTPEVPVTELRERCRLAVDHIRPRVLDGSWHVRRSERLDDLRTDLIAQLRGQVV